MSKVDSPVFKSSQGALLADLLLLFKVSNLTEDKDEIEDIKKKRKAIHKKLDAIEISEINSNLLPKEVEQAINALDKLTKNIVDEHARIEKATENINKVDKYLSQADKLLKIVGPLFLLI